MKRAILLLSLSLALVSVQGFVLQSVRIVNGTTSAPGQFPYQVMVIASIPFGQALCGGTLISDQWIVTAGHCIDGAYAFEVHLGAQKFNDYTEPGREIYFSFDSILHERYTASIAANDIGLIKLPNKVNFTKNIQPASLPTSQDLLVGKTVIASGWGLQSTSASRPASELQYAPLQVLSNEECAKSYDPVLIRPSIICAKGANLQSPCSGDSGGPLVLNGTRTLVGITSFGSVLGCDFGYPGGFSRVAYFLDWISAKTGIKV
ncbi:unnamed protein product [Hermetia illucens]|uniref:Peptidase S1 domain-containing protein n=1 Tax=Hermetia illucens TaxID=343691 RepID=A0A7R8YRS0_HERIL|nr:brachyurin-like [Hermetia illucens]CAD7083013.1 unnamed protein product [Hermetia illucens]